MGRFERAFGVAQTVLKLSLQLGRRAPLRGILMPLVASALCVSFSVQEAKAGLCDALIGTCSYYTCMNEKMQCQPQQYFKRFAEKYCNIFDARQDRFTEVGRQTLQQIKTCLQDKIESESNLTCDNALSKAYVHHRDCYLASGFCTLPISDKFAILGVVYPELRRPGFEKAILQTVGGCLRSQTLDQSEGTALTDSILLRP